jgi:PKD repeat protein
VDGGSAPIATGASHTFNWTYTGTFGGQGAMIRPAIGVGGRPTAEPNGPYSANEGQAIVFSSAGSIDPEGSSLTYLWRFGDGSKSTGANPTKKYSDNGSYVVTLIVTDPAGNADTAATGATINNVPPTATISTPNLIEGSEYVVRVSLNDAGSADVSTLEFDFDCGDGGTARDSIRQRTSLISCSYQFDQGVLTFHLVVRDKDGGQREYNRTVTVKNALPVIDYFGVTPASVQKGATVTADASFQDRGEFDAPWTYSFAWGDGSAPTTGTWTGQPGSGAGLHADHTYTKAGTFYVQLSVTDKDGGVGKSRRIAVTVSP